MNTDDLVQKLESHGYEVRRQNYRTGRASQSTNAAILDVVPTADPSVGGGKLFVRFRDGSDGEGDVWLMQPVTSEAEVEGEFPQRT